jgi:hypothetical protein
MRKISLIPYNVGENEYPVRETLINLLYSPHLRLGARTLIDNGKIATKIESASDSILLEESEFEKLKNAVETFEGYGRHDVELVRRVLEAQDVPIKEA